MQNKAWSIGRIDSNKCDILLQGDSISGIHATLNFQDGRFYLIDNDSTNGTYILRDGQKYEITKHTEIYPRDTIIFSQSEYQLDDLIEYSEQVQGTSTNSLIVVSGISVNSGYENNDNDLSNSTVRQVELASQNNSKKDYRKDRIDDKTKKIRCFECTTVIPINKPCSQCGSDKHMEE
jgi:hypothetical protein